MGNIINLRNGDFVSHIFSECGSLDAFDYDFETTFF